MDRPVPTWDELRPLRWGGADRLPGIDNPGRRPAAVTLRLILDNSHDPEGAAEREAVRDDGTGPRTDAPKKGLI